MILRGEVLDGETVNVTVEHNKLLVQPNHEVMYDTEENEDVDDMDIDVEELE
jgi:hypothetical protein